MDKRKIYFDDPNVGEKEKAYIGKAIDSNYVSSVGAFVGEFEETFSKTVGVKGAVSTQSCTSAIHLVLLELGINEGAEVIVPVLTYTATVNPVYYTGATPVFVDVDIKTWNILPEEIERAITSKSKAIIPVHLYGNPCDMDRIMDIADKYGLYVIEDAAESFGSTYKGRYTGTIGHFGCFSFNGNKVITTGGGGMVVSNREQNIEHIKFLASQARGAKDGAYYHPEVGFNYRMTNIESALGLAQLERAEEFLVRKKRFNRIYREAFKDLDFIRFQEETEDSESQYWLTSIIIDKDFDILKLHQRLKEKGVPSRRIFMPLIEFPPFKKFKTAECHNAYSIYEKGLCLPSSTLNSDEDIIAASEILCDVLKNV